MSVFLRVLFVDIMLSPRPRKNCHKLVFNIVSNLQSQEYKKIITNKQNPILVNKRVLFTNSSYD